MTIILGKCVGGIRAKSVSAKGESTPGIRVLPPDVAHQLFQAVQLQLVHLLHLLAEQPIGKTLVFIPDQIIFGKVNEVTAFEFAERHFGVREFDEEFFFWNHVSGTAALAMETASFCKAQRRKRYSVQRGPKATPKTI